MQDEINQAEWRNPDSWGGTSWAAYYFSKKDNRVFVPHRRLPGWTINLATRAGALSYMAVTGGAITVLLFTNLVMAGLLMGMAN